MISVVRVGFAVFADRHSNRWIIRDPDGQFWVVPAGDNGWQEREPLDPNDDVELEPVPGHYRYLFDLPF